MSNKIDLLTIPSLFNNKQVNYDVHLPDGNEKHPAVIFCHGFKGFKDWGHFDLVADFFTQHGFATFKINFSHNGTSPKNPIDFVDLEAFGNNNFTIELSDLDQLITEICKGSNSAFKDRIDSSKIYLLGHSKGGSTSIIKSVEDDRISGLITWAAVCNIYNRYSDDEMGDWKKEGVKYIYNARTDQQMPLYYQLAEDVLDNKTRFNIASIVKDLNKPYLIIHGTEDETVSVEEAQVLHTNSPNSKLELIEGAGHTFEGSHPWESPQLPEATLIACKKTIEFLLSIV